MLPRVNLFSLSRRLIPRYFCYNIFFRLYRNLSIAAIVKRSTSIYRYTRSIFLCLSSRISTRQKDNSNECVRSCSLLRVSHHSSHVPGLTSHGDAYTSLSMSFQLVNMRPSEASTQNVTESDTETPPPLPPVPTPPMIASFYQSRRLRDDDYRFD